MNGRGIDDKGNPIEWLDAWHSGNGWYSADKMGAHEPEITASNLDRIKTLIDRELTK